nr:cocaine- and amphetamine-regulated transcript protein [Misgurnus anguillicaudatus]
MSSLSVLFIALHCILYLNCKISCVDSRPPDNSAIGPRTDGMTEGMTRAASGYQERLQKHIVPMLKRKFSRLPGVCRRLKRRRITILCNTAKFCSARRFSRHGQLCSCPKGSKCNYFFLWSL